MIVVECENPEVLAEHQRRHWGQRAVQFFHDDAGCETSSCADLAEFEHEMAAGVRYRLVFSDAAAAGQGLVDYRDRLEAVVQHRLPGRTGWEPSGSGGPVEVARLISMGEEYRIVGSAPATPEPERPATGVSAVLVERATEAWYESARQQTNEAIPGRPMSVRDRTLMNFLSVTEAARVLGVSKQAVSGRIARGSLVPDAYVGSAPGFFRSTIERLVRDEGDQS